MSTILRLVSLAPFLVALTAASLIDSGVVHPGGVLDYDDVYEIDYSQFDGFNWDEEKDEVDDEDEDEFDLSLNKSNNLKEQGSRLLFGGGVEIPRSTLRNDKSITAETNRAVGAQSVLTITDQEILLQGLDKATGRTIMGPTLMQDMFQAAGITTQHQQVVQPKILYDTHQERFVLLALAANLDSTSTMLLAVSKHGNPQDASPNSWFFHSISCSMGPDATLGLTEPVHAESPAMAVDEQALYITANMFHDDGFHKSLLWILHKKDFYSADGATAFSVHDYLQEARAPATFLGTFVPATVKGVNGVGGTDSPVGTYLVGYGGFAHEVLNGLMVIAVSSPLDQPEFRASETFFGRDLDSRAHELQHATDRRVTSAVWHDNNLWVVATLAAAEATTAFWVRLRANGLFDPMANGFGKVDNPAIAPGAHTFDPSINVSPETGKATIGFTASSPTLLVGAAYTITVETDGITVTGPPQAITKGADPYLISWEHPSAEIPSEPTMAASPTISLASSVPPVVTRSLCQMNTPLSWEMANSLAQGLGCHLASIESSDERLNLSLEPDGDVVSQKLWTGGMFQSETSSWIWTDGSPFSGGYWDVGQPNGISEFGAMSGNVTYVAVGAATGVLFDESGSALLSSVMECPQGCPDHPMILGERECDALL